MEVGSISLSHREGSHYFSVLNLRKESLLGTDSLGRTVSFPSVCVISVSLISPVTPFPMESWTIIVLGAATSWVLDQDPDWSPLARALQLSNAS